MYVTLPLELLHFSALHPQLVFQLFTLNPMDLPHDTWQSHSKIKTKTQDVLTYICRFILVMVVDSTANYAKEITKEKDHKG